MRTEHDQGDKRDNESFHIRVSASFKRKGVDRVLDATPTGHDAAPMGDDDVSMRLVETRWMEARDGIEPPSMGLQTLPASFRVPRHLSQQLIASRVEGNASCDPP